MLGVDKACFFEKLPLSEQTKMAVDDCAGPMGHCLRIALKLEQLVQMKQQLHKVDIRLLTSYRTVSAKVQELFNTI
jgi:EAL and modified HD-GYP domain-containing signal transduction protein